MKLFLIVLAAALGVMAIYFGISELIVTDEERIESLVERVCNMIANEDLAGCMTFVGDDFTYQPKGVNKARLASLAQGIFARADKLEVTVSELRIEVDGDKATVFLRFRLLGEYVGRMDRFVGQRGFILGKPLKAARATLHLDKRRTAEGEALWVLYRVTDFDPGN